MKRVTENSFREAEINLEKENEIKRKEKAVQSAKNHAAISKILEKEIENENNTLPIIERNTPEDSKKPDQNKPFGPKRVCKIISNPGCNGKPQHVELERDPIIIDNIDYESPSFQKFAKENYFNAMDITQAHAPNVPSMSTTMDARIEMDTSLPNTNNLINTGKTFYEANKDAMAQQMNVVAFYSIKDSKPFYYVSSAEARMAIEYINMTRQYKVDMLNFFDENYEIVKNMIENKSSLDGFNCKDNPDHVYVDVFNMGMFNLEDGGHDLSWDGALIEKTKIIQQIEKTEPFIIRHKNIVIEGCNVRIKLVKDLIDVPLSTIIDIHDTIAFTYDAVSYIIAGREIIGNINYSEYTLSSGSKYGNGFHRFAQNKMGIVGGYFSGKHTKKDIFFDKSITGKSITIFSRSQHRAVAYFYTICQ